jgi:hypothetical protein
MIEINHIKALIMKYLIYPLVIILFTLLAYPPSSYAQDIIYVNPPSKTFMQKWLICGPFPINMETAEESNWTEKTPQQEKAYSTDFLLEHGGEQNIKPTTELTHLFEDKPYKWKFYESKKRKIDFWDAYGEIEHAVAYAYAEIESSEERTVYLRLGSDDAMKIWLNGELVYEYWGGRQLSYYSSSVPVTLKKGSNSITVKVLNMMLHWEFVCRIVEPKDMPLSHTIGKVFSIKSNRSPEEIQWRILMMLSILVPIGLITGVVFVIVLIKQRINRN